MFDKFVAGRPVAALEVLYGRPLLLARKGHGQGLGPADIVEGISSAPASSSGGVEEKGSSSVAAVSGSYAVAKFNLKAGKVVEASDLEADANINQLIDSRLLDVSSVMSPSEVIGKKLVTDVNALTGFVPEHFGETRQEIVNQPAMGGGILKIQIQF